jgi:hypothetical protein
MPAKYLGLYMGRSVICSPYGLALATLWALALVDCSPMVLIRVYPYKNILILLLYICVNLFYTYHINKQKGFICELSLLTIKRLLKQLK